MDWLELCLGVFVSIVYSFEGVIAVLVIGGVRQEVPPPSTKSLFNEHPDYHKTAKQFISTGSRVVGPAGLLYVKQREMAVTHRKDKSVHVIGSDEATSCIVVILRHTGSGAVGLSHFDGKGTEEAVARMVSGVKKLTVQKQGEYELSLIGGVTDKTSEKVFSSLMSAFHKQPVDVHLRLACVGEPNTLVHSGINWPKFYGAGVNVKTGEIFAATFSDKGPEQALRSVRYLTGGREVMDIYDCDVELMKIGPFDYRPRGDVEKLLKLGDKELLQRMSTTPEVEPEDFVAETRATLRYIRDNPFPAVTVFPDGQPHYYQRDKRTCQWSRVKKETVLW